MRKSLLVFPLVLLSWLCMARVPPPWIGLEAKLRAAVARELSVPARVHVEHLFLKSPVPGGAELVVLSPHPPLGLVHFELSWWSKDGEKRAFGSAVVRAHLPVAVARAPIRHGEAFSSENVSLEEREISAFVQSGFYSDWKSLARLRAVGSLHVGQVVGTANAQAVFAVTRGQQVELRHEQGRLEIIARVRALENGGADQWVRVENPSTHRIVQARVVAPGQVSLD